MSCKNTAKTIKVLNAFKSHVLLLLYISCDGVVVFFPMWCTYKRQKCRQLFTSFKLLPGIYNIIQLNYYFRLMFPLCFNHFLLCFVCVRGRPSLFQSHYVSKFLAVTTKNNNNK